MEVDVDGGIEIKVGLFSGIRLQSKIELVLGLRLGLAVGISHRTIYAIMAGCIFARFMGIYRPLPLELVPSFVLCCSIQQATNRNAID